MTTAIQSPPTPHRRSTARNVVRTYAAALIMSLGTLAGLALGALLAFAIGLLIQTNDGLTAGGVELGTNTLGLLAGYVITLLLLRRRRFLVDRLLFAMTAVASPVLTFGILLVLLQAF